MNKLNLDLLIVDSFATVDMPQQMRGTVEGQQDARSIMPPFITCWNTCAFTCRATCAPSCRNTECVTACAGGGELTAQGCYGGGTGDGGGGGTTGTGTDYVGCTNDCTTGVTAV